MKALDAQSCPTLYDPMDCRPPGSSVHGVPQARTLEWVAIPFSAGSPQQGTEPVSPALQADSSPSVTREAGANNCERLGSNMNTQLCNHRHREKMPGNSGCLNRREGKLQRKRAGHFLITNQPTCSQLWSCTLLIAFFIFDSCFCFVKQSSISMYLLDYLAWVGQAFLRQFLLSFCLLSLILFHNMLYYLVSWFP